MTTSSRNTVVFCTLQVEGLHNWPDAMLIPEVGYLENTHRHIFNIKAYVQVTHNDRDVEFIVLKHNILKYIYAHYSTPYGCIHFNNMSCEMIAEKLIDHFNLIKCEVNEDGENGAIVTVNGTNQ